MMRKFKTVLMLAAALTIGILSQGYSAKAVDAELTVRESQDITVDSSVNYTNHTGITSLEEGTKSAKFTLVKPAIVTVGFTSTVSSSKYSTAMDYNYILATDEMGVNVLKSTPGFNEESKTITAHLEAGTYYLISKWKVSWKPQSDPHALAGNPIVAQGVVAQYVDRLGGTLGNNYAAASVIPKNTPVTGFFTSTVTWQTYKFTLNKESKVTASTSIISTIEDDKLGSTFIRDNRFLIVDNKYNTVLSDAVPGTRGTGTTVSGNLKAGTYFIVVKSQMQGISSTTLETSTLPTCKVTWKKVKKAKKYQVYQYNTSSKKYQRVATTKKLTYTMTTSKAVNGTLKKGKSYKFKIYAYNNSGKKIKTYTKKVKAK